MPENKKLFLPKDNILKRVYRENIIDLTGGAALLMQIASGIGPVVDKYSNFQQKTFERLERTLNLTRGLVFGTEKEVKKSTERIERSHIFVTKKIAERRNITFEKAIKGSPLDPILKQWVWTTLVYTTYKGALDWGILQKNQVDEFVSESRKWTKFLDLPKDLPKNQKELERFIKNEIRSGRVHVDSTAKKLKNFILNPMKTSKDVQNLVRFTKDQTELSLLLKYIISSEKIARVLDIPIRKGTHSLILLTTSALLPQKLNNQYGLEMNYLQKFFYKASSASVKKSLPFIPSNVRHAPQARKEFKGKHI